LDLERASDRGALEANAETYLKSYEDHLIIIDEVQRMPEIFQTLRPLVDSHRIPGRFLLLGSANPDLVGNSAESLAGRICYTELSGFNFLEVQDDIELNKLWLDGGFPDPCLSTDPVFVHDWRRSFLSTYFERDLVGNLELDVLPTQLERLFSVLSYMQGSVSNVSNLSRSLGIDRRKIEKAIDFMIRSYTIRKLLPFHVNNKKRLVKSPKYYIRDSGLFHEQVKLYNFDQLFRSPLLGASWEGFVLEQIASLDLGLSPYFYRTQAGTECDLVLVRGNVPVFCIESKISSTPKISKGLIESYKDLNPKKTFIVVPNCPNPYPLHKDIEVCNLPFVLNFLKKKIHLIRRF